MVKIIKVEKIDEDYIEKEFNIEIEEVEPYFPANDKETLADEPKIRKIKNAKPTLYCRNQV